MLNNTGAGRTAHYVLPDQLRIGLYIYIDLPWFRHPFTLNSFKISSAEQVRDLCALKEPRFRYDPERSEGRPDEAPVGSAAVEFADGVPNEGAANGLPVDPAMVEKHARIQQLKAHCQAVAQVEQAFLKASTIMRSLNKNLLSRPKEALQEMGGLVDQMVMAFLERPEVTLQVMGEKCGGEEAYFHSLNVSILSMMLAKELNFSTEQARMLGVGAMLHDIGLMEIPDRVLKKRPEEYTKPERELRAMHVEYGLKLGRKLGLAPDILLIIAQHHELADGSGYPQGLKLEKISPLARVVALVNFYDNLCNPVDFAQAMTPHEALSFLFAQRRSKFDAQVLQLMVRSLGVYPPGSVVKLSNDAVAMVISVNTQKSLRPWVLLYDPAVPKEEAIMLDLETATELSISKAIKPSLLPPPVYAYLSPRKRVTYFFGGDSKSAGERT